MKKIVSSLLALTVLFAFCGCGDKDKSGTVNVYAPDGAPAISLSKMIADKYEGAKFNIVAPEQIGEFVANGSADIAIMPTNAAANLYNKGADIAMLGVTNFGSLYVVGNGESAETLSELAGKVVYSIGEGNVPDMVFRILLKNAGLEFEKSENAIDGKVALQYVSDGTALIGQLDAKENIYGVISEPAATVALGKAEGAKRMLDIQKLYGDAFGGTGYPQAALVVKKSFLDGHKSYVAKFVKAFREGAKWSETNPDEALAALKDAGSTAVPKLNAAIAKGCNLGFTTAADAKEQLVDFYTELSGLKAAAIGGKLPADEFYLGAIEA